MSYLPRVMYLRNNKNMPVSCLTYSFNKDKATIIYQLSTLHPDDRFSKKLARAISYGRLLEFPCVIKDVPQECSTLDIISLIMVDITNSKTLPTRTCRAAKRWLNTKPPVRDTLV